MDFIELILMDLMRNEARRVVIGVSQGGNGKKCGAVNGDPNLRSQPRLPGSVVGESSMGQVGKGDKITEVIVLW